MLTGPTMTISGNSDAATPPARTAADAAELFEAFAVANTCHGILAAFEHLCDALDLHPSRPGFFYNELKSRLCNWKAESLWSKLDKRAYHKDYKNNAVCANTRVLVIGAGPCGLRTAIECKLLGAKCVVVEKRDSFSRNNVLHLWPFVIHDLKSLGAKMFFPKFCAGAIDHISIRQLQCILLKVALIFGVEVHVRVSFEGLLEPEPPLEDLISTGHGWRAVVLPSNHMVSQYDFDVLIGADGKRNTLSGFPRKEFRGKLAIAITANFINHRTQEENRVEEISGVAFIFNQKFFKDLYAKTGIDLENIVYYKDDTHYFVMTAKKHSLLEKGVILEDQPDVAGLLAKENVSQQALLDYAREAADVSTNHMLPSLEFAHNGYGQADVAMFDFTSIFAAENSSRVMERQGYRLLMGIVGDSLLEPFWPTGSGCARGFLGALDAAWMIRSWASGTMTPLEVIAERESIYQLLSQTTPENLNKNAAEHSVSPLSRYPKCNTHRFKPSQVRHLYDAPPGVEVKVEEQAVCEPPPPKHSRGAYDAMADSERLLRWYQRQLADCEIPVTIVDLTTSWRDGIALCALLHKYMPDAVELPRVSRGGAPNESAAVERVRAAIDAAQIHLGVTPVISAEDLVYSGDRGPDSLSMLSYLSHLHEVLRSLRRATLSRVSAAAAHHHHNRSLHKRAAAAIPPAAAKVKDLSASPAVPTVHTATEATPPSSHKSSRLSRFFKHTKFSLGRHRARNRAISATAPDGVCEQQPSSRTGAASGAKLLSFKGVVADAVGAGKGSDTSDSRGKMRQMKPESDVTGHDEPWEQTAGDDSSKTVSKVTQIRNRYKEVDDQAKASWTPPPARKVIIRDVTGGAYANGVSSSGNNSDMCSLCGKRVYLVERQSAEGFFFHRSCFRCAYCSVPLRIGGYFFDRNAGNGAGKFSCSYQHLDLLKQSAGVPKRPCIESDKQADVARLLPAEPALLIRIASSDSTDHTGRLKGAQVPKVGTLERAEFENSAEAEEEECEESQTSHNFSTLSSHDVEVPIQVDLEQGSAQSRWEPSDDDENAEPFSDGSSSSGDEVDDDDDTSDVSDEDFKSATEEDAQLKPHSYEVNSSDSSDVGRAEAIQIRPGLPSTAPVQQSSTSDTSKLVQAPGSSSSADASGVSEAARLHQSIQSSASDITRRRSNFFTEAPKPVRLDHRAIFQGMPSCSPMLPANLPGTTQPSVTNDGSAGMPVAAVDERFVNTSRRGAAAGGGSGGRSARDVVVLRVPRTESESSFSVSNPSSEDDDNCGDATFQLDATAQVRDGGPAADPKHQQIAACSSDATTASEPPHGTDRRDAAASVSRADARHAAAAVDNSYGLASKSTAPGEQPNQRRRLGHRRVPLASGSADGVAASSSSVHAVRKKLSPDTGGAPDATSGLHLALSDDYRVFGDRQSPTAAVTERQRSVLVGRFREMCLQPVVPTASAEEFSDDETDNVTADAAPCSGRILQAAQRQQRQLEMKRLHMAQEIQRHLQEVEVQQKELEERGIAIEQALRGEVASAAEVDETKLMKDWFDLVHQKNVLLRYESGLLIQARQLELEDRHSRLEAQFRSRILQRQQSSDRQAKAGHSSIASTADGQDSSLDEQDQRILDELLEVVQQRDQLVQSLEADRLRELEEDAALEEVMIRKGLKGLSPSPYAQSVRHRRQQQQQRQRGSRVRKPRLLLTATLMRIGTKAGSHIDLLWATLALTISLALLSCALAINKLYDFCG